MNLFKSSLFSLLISSSLIIPSLSFAVTETPAAKPTTDIQTNQSTLVANVDIEDARIMSQEGNIFNIGFSLNNKGGLQTGVKYGVQLVPDAAKYIADEKVYDESITLYENTIVKKEIVYTAPTQFGGSYTLLLVSNNESNFPFGVAFLGKVKLTATTKGVQISNDSCYLQVENEKGSPHYTLAQGLDISSSEILKLTCSAINNTSENLSLTPYFETRYFSAYGKLASQMGGDYKAISFTKGEKKVFSLALPKSNTPQFYYLKFALMGATASSNNIFVHYIIRGVNGIIQKISLDKDYYKFGDRGEMSVLWSASSGNFPRSNIKYGTVPAVTLNAKITDKNGTNCANPISQALTPDLKNPETQIPFSVKASCINPHISATLTDKDGNVLDQKDFTFTSSPEHTPKPLSPMQITLIILVILIIATIGIVMRKKKNATM